MKKTNRVLKTSVEIASFLAILYLIILSLLKLTHADSIIGYILIGCSSIFLAFLSLMIIMGILDFMSLIQERQYHKAKIISSKMKHLKKKLEDLNNRYSSGIYSLRQESNYRIGIHTAHGLQNEDYQTQQENYRRERENNFIQESNKIEKEIKYITDEKLNIDFFNENKVGLLFSAFVIFIFILIITQPKNFLPNYEDSKNWLGFFVILIIATSILICKIIKPKKELRYVSIWIFSIMGLAIILFFTKPYFINIESVEELFWYIGCCSLISALTITICKGLE